MRSVVAGAAGFLGSHVVDALLAEGHEVVGLDNLITGDHQNLRHLSSNDRFTLLEQDVSERVDVPGAVDHILHFASPASPDDYLRHPIETLLAGSQGTYRLLEEARSKGAQFLLASTSEIYGDPDREHHPQSEDYFGNVNPIGPRSCYDEAKRFAEALTMAYRSKHAVHTKIVRIFNTYGPRMRQTDGRVIPMFLSQALEDHPLTVFGDGSQTRSFCFVDDLVAGILAVMRSEVRDPVNLGNPDEVSMLDLAQEVLSLTGSCGGICHEPGREDDPRQRRPDISRARTLVGWEPKIGRLDGLGRTLEDFRRRWTGSGQNAS